MSTVFQIMMLLGALGMFLYGMTLMSEGLQKVAGSRLRSILSAMTANSFTRILTGTLITAIIQSSSATTVMIVSFVNAGLLSLTQAVGVIMGANIGTTVTSWLISILGFTADISALSIPLIGVGFIFMMFKSQKRKNIGEMIIGFAMLFLGLSFLKDSVPDLSANPEAIAFIQRWTDWGFFSVLIFVLVGTVMTIVLQSSSATVALTLVMASQGWIPFEMAAAMVLGENIGTTITANIAASVGNISAKRAALAHTVFNVFGVIWVLALYRPFLWLVSKIVVGLGGEDPFVSSASLLYAISTVHTLFNVLNTCVLVWFTPQIVKLVTWVLKGHKDEEEVFRLRYIQGGVMSTSELSLEQAEQEVVHFSEIVKKQYAYARQAVNEADDENRFDALFKKLEHYEQITDRIEFEIAKYLNSIGEGELSQEGNNKMLAMYKIISELESMGDSGFNIGRILQRKNMHSQKFDEATVKKLNHMLDLVDVAIDSMIVNLRQGFNHVINISNAQDAEHDINEYRDNLKEEHLRHLEAEETVYLRGVYYMDLVSECERVGDFAINVSEALVELN
ncbi:MAG TPA: Na/Pi cotransporter family protein [Candidatus Coprenecus stercoravium]|uniref:Na/Pi cotransporter family protein n=1 Tax=Candidatus Coprenecus stercoravium TaxID=2840735 RepID=A0A9D2GQ48_9BACT|nr:Na/Pi cotransporter family protein [Candidatus Coprenecus stercoravium]